MSEGIVGEHVCSAGWFLILFILMLLLFAAGDRNLNNDSEDR